MRGLTARFFGPPRSLLSRSLTDPFRDRELSIMSFRYASAFCGLSHAVRRRRLALRLWKR